MRRTGALSRKGKSRRYNKKGKSNNTCIKCGKLGHFIKDYPLHKVDYKDYFKKAGEREKMKDRNLDKYSKRVASDKVAKKVLIVWGNFSSNSNELNKQEDISIMVGRRWCSD